MVSIVSSIATGGNFISAASFLKTPMLILSDLFSLGKLTEKM